MDSVTITNLLASMADKWPSAWVARTETEKFSGGLIKEKYLANLDSAGMGPEGRFRVARKVCYPVQSFIKWLEERSTIIENKK